MNRAERRRVSRRMGYFNARSSGLTKKQRKKLNAAMKAYSTITQKEG